MKIKMIFCVFVVILVLNLIGCDKDNLYNDSTMEQEKDTVFADERISSDTMVSSDTKASNDTMPSSDIKASSDTMASSDNEASNLDEPSKDDRTSDNHKIAVSDVDVDLTQLSATMVYSEVYNIMVSPEDYIGRTIKMNGTFSIYQDEVTGKNYYTCIISDATACCSQGLEFVWKGEHKYPEDYPELGSEIIVTGEFQTYDENGSLYCNLINAELDMIQP